MDHSVAVNIVPWVLSVVTTGYVVYLTYKLKNQGCCRVNKTVQLNNSKVVHNFKTDQLDKKTVYCRCWKSKKFPYCDGAHNDHNKETGDNLGPLIIENESKLDSK